MNIVKSSYNPCVFENRMCKKYKVNSIEKLNQGNMSKEDYKILKYLTK